MRPNGPAVKYVALLLALATIAGAAAACSPVMEVTRATPTDFTQFQTGDSRESVIARLGQPLVTNHKPGGQSCDMYELYTKGYGAGGKVPIAVAEAAADVFTIGLAELVLTPTEGVTRSEKHPVSFCYKEGKLTHVEGT